MHCLEGLRKINVRMTYHTFCIWAREFPHNDTLRLNLVLCTLKSDCCEYIQQGFIHLVRTQNFPKNSHFLPLWYAHVHMIPSELFWRSNRQYFKSLLSHKFFCIFILQTFLVRIHQYFSTCQNWFKWNVLGTVFLFL